MKVQYVFVFYNFISHTFSISFKFVWYFRDKIFIFSIVSSEVAPTIKQISISLMKEIQEHINEQLYTVFKLNYGNLIRVLMLHCTIRKQWN